MSASVNPEHYYARLGYHLFGERPLPQAMLIFRFTIFTLEACFNDTLFKVHIIAHQMPLIILSEQVRYFHDGITKHVAHNNLKQWKQNTAGHKLVLIKLMLSIQKCLVSKPISRNICSLCIHQMHVFNQKRLGWRTNVVINVGLSTHLSVNHHNRWKKHASFS